VQNIRYKNTTYSIIYKTKLAMKHHRLFITAALALVFRAIAVPTEGKAAGDGNQPRLETVVIDPGHGGKDPGCVSRDGKTFEKDIVLDIGLRLSKKIKEGYAGGVNVKMTREDDRFVELENRAVTANKAGANLFISIHVNAVEKGTTANGYSIHCLGQSKKKGNDLYSKNLDLVKRENSVITLEDNYKTKYQGFDPSDPQSSIIFNLMQNAHLSASLSFAEEVADAMGDTPIKTNRGVSQDPFWVLWRTAMPAVLIEVGFITNPDDLAKMRTEEGREAIAENIYKAFCSFKAKYDSSMTVDKPEESVSAQEVSQELPPREVVKEEVKEQAPSKEQSAAGPQYGVQILATSKDMDLKDPFFRGYKPMLIKSGKLNKYIIAVSSNLREVKNKYPEIQGKFPDSYLVKIENGATSPVR